MNDPVRIAMWSGPRNISTAMMRAWENREDTTVIDEPLYAHYLLTTGLQHPGRDEILNVQNTDAQAVTKMLRGPVPEGKSIWYQKHMTQHVLPDMPLQWMDGLSHCFLIREPEAVAASFTVQRPNASASELGFEQQRRIFEHICNRLGSAPPVFDAADILRNPEAMLRSMCARLNVPFSSHMLHWSAGSRASDGVWARHWYKAVEQSTGFVPWRPRQTELTAFQRRLAEQCRPDYERMSIHCMSPRA